MQQPLDVFFALAFQERVNTVHDMAPYFLDIIHAFQEAGVLLNSRNIS
jgi:hypothetical protein